VRRIAAGALCAVACNSAASSRSTARVDNVAHPPGIALDRVFRDVFVDADRDRSDRNTFELHVAAGRATLTSTHERNVVAQLDEWSQPWKLVQRSELAGTSTQHGDDLVLDLATADRTYVVQLTCSPRTFQVLRADARLVPPTPGARECVADPRGTWTPGTKTRIDGLDCHREGSEEDAIEPVVPLAPLQFVEGGMEWVDVRISCFVDGEAYRRLR
jgi:hypothetical protein